MAGEERAHGKVEIKIGNVTFSAEGEQEWLATQLAKVIEAATPVMSQSESGDRQPKPGSEAERPQAGAIGSLSSYLKAKGGELKQVQRFLATAAWLSQRGTQSLTTSAVSAALAENHQKRLGNPADCLNQNCSKGNCEKTKDGFFITPEGWHALGGKQ